MRFLLASCFLVGTAGAALASFDLMYLPDASQARVHRYDPVNRAYLGSFATSATRFVGAHVNSTNVVTGTSSPVAVYNGSTGEFISGSITFGTAASMLASGNFVALSGATSFRETSVPNLTTVVSSGLSGILEARAITGTSSHRYAVGRDVAGNLVLNTYSLSGAFFHSSTVASDASLAADVTTSSLGLSTSITGQVQLWLTWRTNTGTVRMGRYTVSGNATLLSDTLSLSGFSTANSNATQAVMGGHGSSCFVVGPDSADPLQTRITKVLAFGTSSLIGDTYTTSAFSVPQAVAWNGANVVAPEPGTMAALGLGLVVLLKRRKKRS